MSGPVDEMIKEGSLVEDDKFLFDACVETGFGTKLPDGRYEFADYDELNDDERAEIATTVELLKLEKAGFVRRVQTNEYCEWPLPRPFPGAPPLKNIFKKGVQNERK